MNRIVLLSIILNILIYSFGQNRDNFLLNLEGDQNNDLSQNQVHKFNDTSNYIHTDLGYILRLDTTITNSIDRKTIFLFYNNGKLASNHYYEHHSESGPFELDLINEFKYNKDGYQVLFNKYSYNSDNQELRPYEKFTSEYDDYGNLAVYIKQNWSLENQSFVFDWKYELTHNEHENLLLSKYYLWSTYSQSFYLKSKNERTYNDEGKLSIMLDYYLDFNSDSLVLNDKQEYKYEEGGKLISKFNYDWDSDLLSFILKGKFVQSFNEDNNILYEHSYVWDSESQLFYLFWKNEYSYNDKGNLTTEIQYINQSNTVEPYCKKEYLNYNKYGFYDTFIHSGWNRALEEFRPGLKIEYSIIDVNESNLIRIEDRYKYNSDLDIWELIGITDYNYYTKIYSLNTQKFESIKSISISPNPTKGDQIYIHLPSDKEAYYHIYNATSQLVKQGFLLAQKKQEIDISVLPSGWFILEVIQNGKTYRTKMIKN